jgi:hypothetical protein
MIKINSRTSRAIVKKFVCLNTGIQSTQRTSGEDPELLSVFRISVLIEILDWIRIPKIPGSGSGLSEYRFETLFFYYNPRFNLEDSS